MKQSRVYLHALGMLNALGDNVDAIARALATGTSPGMGLAKVGVGDPAFVGRVCAPLELAPPPELARYDCRNNRLLLLALRQIEAAIGQAREKYGAARIGVVLGTSTSGIDAAEAALLQQLRSGALPPQFNYRQMEIGTVAQFAARALGLRGPALTVSTACTSSAKAVASAARLLRANLCDAVIVGGVDSLCELTVRGFSSLESTSLARSNPMSRNRCGINVGEGAAVFLMSRDEAQVSLAGVGESSDAHHVSAPDPEGVGGEIALRAALSDAGVAPDAIGYLNLHATATPKNDDMEAKLTARVFHSGSGSGNGSGSGVPASGTKPFTGHLLGAAGATELGFAWLALDESHGRARIDLPRHLWDGEADPALPALDLVERAQRLSGAAYAMSNSFAFGGSNVSLILAG